MSTPLGPSCGRSLCTHLRLNMVHGVPMHFLTHVVHSLNNVSSYVTTQIIIFHHCRGNPLATHQKKNFQCKGIRQTQTLSKRIATGGSRTLKCMLLHKHGSWCMHFVGCIGLWSRCPPFLFWSNIRLPNLEPRTCCSSAGCTVICAATSHYMVFI